jgi:hypothetical protein
VTSAPAARRGEGSLGAGETLQCTSELGEGGVVFGDGIEADRLRMDWGDRIEVGVAKRCLTLVV